MWIFYGYIGLPDDKITANFGRIQVATNPKSKVDFSTVLCASTDETWALWPVDHWLCHVSPGMKNYPKLHIGHIGIIS